MKSRFFVMLLTALLMGSISASAQDSGTPVKGDVNGDGAVNAADIVEIVNIIMGKGGDQQIVYYWYVGPENPMNMTDITPLPSNDASAGAGWRTIGVTLPAYSKENPLWESSNDIATIPADAPKVIHYVALPSDQIKSRNDITGQDITLGGWIINNEKKTLNGVEYTIWTSNSNRRSFSETLY